MRQGGGQYVDSGGNVYEMQQQRIIEHKPNNNFGGHINSENNEKSSSSSYGYAHAHAPPFKGEGEGEVQWRWDRDGSSHSHSHIFNQAQGQGQGGDASRPYYQGQRSEHQHHERLNISEKHSQGNDLRSQPHREVEEDIEEIGGGYGHTTFEALQQRFYDDIFKLTKQQNDAEDAENARHRERVNAISLQYEEQLGALRTRYTNRRDEFLRRESHARQQQYQRAAMEQQQYANTGMGMGFTDPPPPPPHHHGYNVNSYRDRDRDKPRFTRDPDGFAPPPPGGHVYGSASRYY